MVICVVYNMVWAQSTMDCQHGQIASVRFGQAYTLCSYSGEDHSLQTLEQEEWNRLP